MYSITYFVILLCGVNALAKQWVDPHDMNTNAKAKYVKPTLKKSQSTISSAEEIPIDMSFLLCSANLRRLVKVVMNSAQMDKRDSELYKGYIQFKIKPTDYDFLLNLGKDGDLSLEELRKLDTIFSESFRKSYIDEYFYAIEDYSQKLYSLIVNIHNLWMLGALFMLYVVYQLFKNEFSFAYIIKYLMIVVLIVDFGYRYNHLLKEADEHNLKVVYSKQCDTELMSWTDWTKYIFSSVECEQKVVTPLDAFLYQIKHLIIVPMHAMGTGMGGFGSNMFTNLPWGLNLILWPIMLIFVLIFSLFIMTICTGQSIEFNFFHMIKMRFGSQNQAPSVTSGNSSTPNIEQSHRPMVQNIHITVPSGSNGEQNSPKSSNKSNKIEMRSECSQTSNTSRDTNDKGTNTAYVPDFHSEQVQDPDKEENDSNSAGSDLGDFEIVRKQGKCAFEEQTIEDDVETLHKEISE